MGDRFWWFVKLKNFFVIIVVVIILYTIHEREWYWIWKTRPLCTVYGLGFRILKLVYSIRTHETSQFFDLKLWNIKNIRKRERFIR